MKNLYSKNPKKYKLTTLCKTLNVSRNAFNNYTKKPLIDVNTKSILDNIKNIIANTRKYGYRRVSKQLKNNNIIVNHKKVLKLMRNNNLLCKSKKSFKVTTNSNHNLPKYKNLIKYLTPSYINQIWASDITYVRLNNSFIYLAVVLDLFSRKVIGWSISKYIDENLTISALNMALSSRNFSNGLIHHSDRGVQYASINYTNLLKLNGIEISMSRPANPYDNAFLESFMKTIKQEEIYMNEYDDLNDAIFNISNFIEEVYNKKRIHSSIGHLSPTDYEFAFNSVSKVTSFSVPR